MRAIAEAVLNEFIPRINDAYVLALSGELGSGKTCFTQQLAAHLGVEEAVTSPTFILEKRYPLKHSQFDNLIHIDAYRFESEKDLKALRFDELLKNPRNLIVIEWAEKIKDALPKGTLWLYFEHQGGTKRRIKHG